MNKPKSPGVDSIMKPPKVPPGEDETSFNRHNKVLILESKKAHPNMTVVRELMQTTFALRRRDILNTSYNTQTLFSKYTPSFNIKIR